MRRAWICVALAGCLFPDTSGLGGDASSDVVDVQGDASGEADALVMCDPSKPFASIQFVAGVGTSDAENPRLSVDELELFYQLYGDAGKTQMVHATRTSTLDPFGSPVFLDELNVPTANTWDAMLSPDGVTLVFASDRAGQDAIYRAMRPSPTSSFGSPALVLGVASPYQDDKPYVQGMNVALWYTSQQTGNGDIYVAENTGTDYGGGVPETELNTAAEEGFPVVSADGTLIYFYRAAPTDAGIIVDHMWMAQRSSVSLPFGTPTPIPEINATFGDVSPAWLSPDLCRLYFTSDKTGVYLPYIASRSP